MLWIFTLIVAHTKSVQSFRHQLQVAGVSFLLLVAILAILLLLNILDTLY